MLFVFNKLQLWRGMFFVKYKKLIHQKYGTIKELEFKLREKHFAHKTNSSDKTIYLN